MSEPNWEEVADAAYMAFGLATGDKNFRSEPIPDRSALPERIRLAWKEAAIAAALAAIDPGPDASRSGPIPSLVAEWIARGYRRRVLDGPTRLTPLVPAALQALRSHAEGHRVERAELLRRFEAKEPVLDRRFCRELPFGFRVVFTVEEHPAGWCRHLSVSAATPGRLPNSHALKLIGRELGMRMDIFDPSSTSYTEGDPPFAVNIVELIDPGGLEERGGS